MGWQRKQGNKRKNYQRSKKEKWTGSKAFDHSCANNGDCPWCEGNRTFNERKKIHSKQEELIEGY